MEPVCPVNTPFSSGMTNLEKHHGMTFSYKVSASELPAQVLFISGTRDPFMGDFKLMENTLKSKLRHILVPWQADMSRLVSIAAEGLSIG